MKDSIVLKATNLIDNQLSKLQAMNSGLSKEIPIWKDRTIRILSTLILSEEIKLLAQISGNSWEAEKILLANYLIDLRKGIVESPEYYLLDNQPLQKIEPILKTNKTTSNKVFIVNGHDSLAKTEVARAIEKLALEAIILHEQANEGKTVIEKFERDASQVGFAVVILTPDDIGYPKNKPDDQKPRARQNVILELGYFSGILGRENVCVLYKDEVEIPSDYLGVVYINMDDEGSWKFKLAKELKQAGLQLDLNKLF